MAKPTFEKSAPFTSYQKIVVAILAFLQFTVIFDFMIISPLGAILMPALKITPAQFGLAVSVYAFSAGASGLIAAGFADRFDRKKFLLFFYAGFLLGTFLCGFAQTYKTLLIARTVTGLFGGVIGSVVFAITTDLFAFEQRGRVMGFIQSAFAASQILGLPAGLYLANTFNWHAAFYLIVAIGALAGMIIIFKLKPVTEHLTAGKRNAPSALHHLTTTFSNTRYLFAFAAASLLSVGGFMLVPFGSAYSVHNLGISIDRLPIIYLITGICAMFTGPLVGRAADRFGKFNILLCGAGISIVMVLIYTNLGITPLPMVILVNAVMFVGIFSRMIPSQALMSAIPTKETRGSFMSVSSSLQQFSGGIASVIAGLVVTEGIGGHLEHFNVLGYILVGTTLITTFQIYYIHKSYVTEANKPELMKMVAEA
jgi:predicted MFS family arabinose efflux permease